VSLFLVISAIVLGNFISSDIFTALLVIQTGMGLQLAPAYLGLHMDWVSVPALVSGLVAGTLTILISITVTQTDAFDLSFGLVLLFLICLFDPINSSLLVFIDFVTHLIDLS